jgi:hypothetical protein
VDVEYDWYEDHSELSTVGAGTGSLLGEHPPALGGRFGGEQFGGFPGRGHLRVFSENGAGGLLKTRGF